MPILAEKETSILEPVVDIFQQTTKIKAEVCDVSSTTTKKYLKKKLHWCYNGCIGSLNNPDCEFRVTSRGIAIFRDLGTEEICQRRVTV